MDPFKDALLLKRRGAQNASGHRPVEHKERSSYIIQLTRKVDPGAGDDLAEEGELADAPVLDLDVPEAVEALLVLPGQLAEVVEEAEGGLGAELVLEGHVGGDRGTGGLLGRGEGGGASDEGCNDSELHGFDKELEELGQEIIDLRVDDLKNCEPSSRRAEHRFQIDLRGSNRLLARWKRKKKKIAVQRGSFSPACCSRVIGTDEKKDTSVAPTPRFLLVKVEGESFYRA